MTNILQLRSWKYKHVSCLKKAEDRNIKIALFFNKSDHMIYFYLCMLKRKIMKQQIGIKYYEK